MLHPLRSLKALAVLTLLAICAGAPAGPAHAIWHIDVVIGASGSFDQKDGKKIAFKGHRAAVRNKFDQAEVTLHYDIQPTHLSGGVDIDELTLGVQFRTNEHGRVIARLKQHNLRDEIITTLLVLDSDDFNETGDLQMEWVDVDDPSYNWQPWKAYYLEVKLIKTAPDGVAEIGGAEVWVRDI